MKRRIAVRKLGRAAEKAFLVGLFALMTHYAATKNAGVGGRDGAADGRGGAAGERDAAAERDDAAASRAAPVPVVSAASGGAYAHDLAPGETFGPLALPTGFVSVAGLSFFDFAPSPTGVWLGAAWAPGERPAGGRFGVWGAWRLASDAWAQVAAVDAADAVSNFAAFVDWPSSLAELVGSGSWPTNADGAAGFFRLLPDAADERDSDGDGLTDAEESLVHRTDPNCADTDGDGDPDGWEIDRRLDPRVDEPGIGLPASGGAGAAACSAPARAPGRRRLAAPGRVENVTDGMPQVEDGGAGSGDDENYFSRSWSLPFVAAATGRYTFTLAADDEATLSIAGQSLSVDWDSDHGSPRSMDVDLVAGRSYSLSVSYENSGGGPYFLSTSYSGPTALDLPYDPGLLVEPGLVAFSLGESDRTDLMCVAKKVGTFDPDKTYTVVGTPGPGVVCDGESAWPDLADPCWHDGMTSRVDFALFESSDDGESEVASGSCLFVCTPVKEPDPCGCCHEGTTAENGCVSFAQAFGRTPGAEGLPVGRAVVRESCPHASLGTAAALRYDHPMMRRIVRRHNLDAVVVDGLGTPTEYFRGRPVGVSGGEDGCLFRDADGAFVEILPDGLRVVYDDAGSVAALQPENGRRVAVADLGIAVTRNAAGAIVAVDSVADGHLAAVATGSGAWRLAWTSPTGAPVKTFDFSYSTSARVFALHEQRGAAFGFDYRWTYEAALGDWVFEQGVGTPDAIREEKSLTYDATTRDWTATRTRRGADGNALVATESVLNRDGHAVRETARRDAATGQVLAARTLDALGRIARETDERGLVTRYAYDEWNRVTEETSVDVENALTNAITFTYAPADHGAVERRPVTRTTSLNGETLLEESFAYATNALGGAVILRRRATVGGTPRIAYEEYDDRARPTLTVREDGRATRIAYGEPDGEGTWLETEDEGVIDGWSEIFAASGEVPSQPSQWSQLSQQLAAHFAIVPGKSTREIRAVSAQGDVVCRESYAWPLGAGDPLLLSSSTTTYSPTHKPTFAAHSDGTTEAADWICPGPVWQTSRDGVTVSNEYSGAKLLAATTRYGAFGPVTTRYDRDAAGRIIRETTVAPNCETQAVTRTYDSRDRVTSDTDAQGCTTTTAYSDDDRVTTTTFADGGTRIVTRNADGTLASITGTTVTPEYHTYGVEAMDVGGNMVGRGLRSAPSGGEGDTSVVNHNF